MNRSFPSPVAFAPSYTPSETLAMQGARAATSAPKDVDTDRARPANTAPDGAVYSDDVPRPPVPASQDAELHELVDGLYEDLRREARKQLAARPLHTLQPTALLNEALVRLLSQKQRASLNEGQLCIYVAKIMRSVLVDHARAKGSAKRGGNSRAVPLDQIREPVYREGASVDILAIHDALEVLARDEPEFAELAELRFFGRLSVQEVAAARQVPESRVKVASQCLRRILGESR